jgi:hypothetical protein
MNYVTPNKQRRFKCFMACVTNINYSTFFDLYHSQKIYTGVDLRMKRINDEINILSGNLVIIGQVFSKETKRIIEILEAGHSVKCLLVSEKIHDASEYCRAKYILISIHPRNPFTNKKRN